MYTEIMLTNDLKSSMGERCNVMRQMLNYIMSQITDMLYRRDCMGYTLHFKTGDIHENRQYFS